MSQKGLITGEDAIRRTAMVERRLSALGMYREKEGVRSIDLVELKLGEDSQEASYRRKLGPAE